MGHHLLIALALSAPSAQREAAVEPAVAVVVGVTVNVDPARADEHAEGLARALVQRLLVRAVGGSSVRARLPEGGVPEDCLAKQACLQDLGNRLNAEQLVVLVMVQLGAHTQIEPTWVDVASGAAVGRPPLVLEADTDPATTFAEAAPKLLPDAAPRPPAAAEVVAIAPVVPGPERDLTWVYTSAGVGGAALLTGIVLGASAAISKSSLDADGCRARVCDAGRIDGMESRALWADVMYGTALVAGAVAAVLYFKDDAPEAAPVVGTDGQSAWVGVGGTF